MSESRNGARVRLELEGHVARIVLDAPEQHNALEARDVSAFRAHLEAVEADASVRVLIVTGTGERTFCAGASLRQMESGEMSGDVFDTLTDRLAAVRVPMICALNGSVYGGGAEIALCCDFRVGVRDSRLAVPAARLGVCYPLGGLTRYVQRLGLATAERLLVASEEMEAEEMLRVGFLTRLVERSELETATEELAARIASGAPLAVQAMKRILRDVAAGAVHAERARALIEACAASEDLREGLTARREGRKPVFEGR